MTHEVVGSCQGETRIHEHIGISPAEGGWTVANDNETCLVVALNCNVLQHGHHSCDSGIEPDTHGQYACLSNSGPQLQHVILPCNTIKYLLIARLASLISASLLSTRMQLGAKLEPSGSKLLQAAFRSPRIFWLTTVDSLQMSAHTIGRPEERQRMDWYFCTELISGLRALHTVLVQWFLRSSISQAYCKLALTSHEPELSR
jgi:hypothetical protein